MRKMLKALLFFIGWMLSPFTWWNDAFVNMPLSYLLANIIYCAFRLPFKWLVIGSYWFTNALGLWFMYSSGKEIIVWSKDRLKSVIIIIAFVITCSAIMLYLDSKGRLVPLSLYFEKYCVNR